MRRKAILAFLVLVTSGACYAQQMPTPPDSFLRYRVNSIEQFITQVEQDAVIRQRMAKHFHVSQDELLRYLRENLRVVTVPASGRYTVYGVTRTGRIYRSSSYLRKGWRAYGLDNGTLLFKWSCGNPMTTQLPKQEVAAVIEEAPPAPVAPPVQTAPPAVPVEEPVVSLVPAHEWSYPTAPQLPATPVYQVAPLIQTAALSSAPGWLAALPLLGALHDHDHPKPPPVPEPGSLLLVGTGLSVLAWRMRRQR